MSARSALPTKDCVVCGRTITWRKKWERDWEQVRYCSDACRRSGISDTDRALEAALVDLMARVVAGGTVCPSQAARAVAPDDWRPLMPAARSAARRRGRSACARCGARGVSACTISRVAPFTVTVARAPLTRGRCGGT